MKNMSISINKVMLKKLGILFSLGILLTVSCTTIDENNNSNSDNYPTEESKEKEIDASKISIGGIKLGMREKDIVEILGEPKSRTINYDDACYGAYITTWKYDGLDIEGLSNVDNSSQSEVYLINAYNSNYPTEKKIRIGDSITKAQKAYSNFSALNVEQEKLVYPNDAYGGLTFFTDTQRKINKISLLAGSC